MGKRNKRENLMVENVVDADLDALLSDVGETPAPAGDEVVENAGAIDELDAVVEACENTDAADEGAVEGAQPVEASSDEPASEPETVEAVSETPVAVEGESSAAEPADEPESQPETVAEKPAKKPSSRIYFGRNKVGRLRHNLGEKLGDFLVLTVQDAELEGDALKAKQDETLEIIGKMGVKVANRATNFLEFASGKRSSLNNVIHIALQVLAKDGKITTGDKGNLHAALLAKPYAPSAARAMGNNTVNMLRLLKVLQGDRPTLTANPDSLLLLFVAGKLSLTFEGFEPEGDEGNEDVEVAPIEGEGELLREAA